VDAGKRREGDYFRARRRLSGLEDWEAVEWAYAHAFNTDDLSFLELTEAWRQAIRARREAGGA
jgi:hypothetical protein